MRWDSVIDVEAPPHPSRVAVIVSVDYRRAVDWCRTYGTPVPPARGAPYIVTRASGTDRIRGCNFYEDDEYIILGTVDPDLVAEVDERMRVGKMRKMGPRPVAV